MIIRKHNAILYASAGAPIGVKNTRLGKIERIHSDGRSWTSRTLKSANSDVEVTLVTPAAGGISLSTSTRAATTSCRCWCVFLSSVSRMAVNPHRYAPWNNVVNEIASRAPEESLSVKGGSNAPGA